MYNSLCGDATVQHPQASVPTLEFSGRPATCGKNMYIASSHGRPRPLTQESMYPTCMSGAMVLVLITGRADMMYQLEPSQRLVSQSREIFVPTVCLNNCCRLSQRRNRSLSPRNITMTNGYKSTRSNNLELLLSGDWHLASAPRVRSPALQPGSGQQEAVLYRAKW